MSNITITNIDTGSVVLELQAAEDGILSNVDVGPDPTVFPAGTVLARNGANFEPYDPAATPPSALLTPVAVLTYEVTVPAAGTLAVRVLTAGTVNASRCSLADGTALTADDRDALRDQSIIPVIVEQLALPDNPQT